MVEQLRCISAAKPDRAAHLLRVKNSYTGSLPDCSRGCGVLQPPAVAVRLVTTARLTPERLPCFETSPDAQRRTIPRPLADFFADRGWGPLCLVATINARVASCTGRIRKRVTHHIVRIVSDGKRWDNRASRESRLQAG